jgi:glycosyltransferase involved in cell wall biosynthesis
MITYNHEKYIVQAIKSVFSQKGDFTLELVIGIDLSDDNTLNLCQDLKKKLSTDSKSFKILTTKNRLGMARNLQRTLNTCKGKYIAFLEGDDYWTSSTKLLIQKQFLDQYPNVDICSTLFSTYVEKNNETIKPIQIKTDKLFRIDFDYACVKNPFGTLTVMVRNNITDIPNWIWEMSFIDWPLYCFYLIKNNVGYILNSNTATYRLHSNGVFGSKKRMSILQNTNLILSKIKKEFSTIMNNNTLQIIDRNIYKNNRSIFYLRKQTSGITLKNFIKLFFLLKRTTSKCKINESKNLINYFLFH